MKKNLAGIIAIVVLAAGWLVAGVLAAPTADAASAIPIAAPITWSRLSMGPPVVLDVSTVSACVGLKARVEYKVFATTEAFISTPGPAVALVSEPIGRGIEYRGFAAEGPDPTVCAVTAAGTGKVFFTPQRSLR